MMCLEWKVFIYNVTNNYGCHINVVEYHFNSKQRTMGMFA